MRITTIKKVYWYDTNNENRDIGFVIIWDNDRKYLEITLEFTNKFYIGREKPNEFGTGFIIRLGFLNIVYTNHYEV